MLMDVFSSFDPANNNTYYEHPIMFWMLPMITGSIMCTNMWAGPTLIMRVNSYMTKASLNMLGNFTPSMKGLPLMISGLLMYLIGINIMGLTPYTFSVSSHLMMTLTLSIPMWLAIVLSSWTFSIMSAMALTLPEGAPWWLNPFIWMVEITSSLMRPMILGLRLSANMTAGHIMLTLMSDVLIHLIMGPSTTYPIAVLLLTCVFTGVEVIISFLQAYIFSVLLLCYMSEHTNSL